jgi:hypothetical protein
MSVVQRLSWKFPETTELVIRRGLSKKEGSEDYEGAFETRGEGGLCEDVDGLGETM